MIRDIRNIEVDEGIGDFTDIPSYEGNSTVDYSYNTTTNEETNLFGENFEIFDQLKSEDELWKNKDFRKQINDLGPDIFKNPKLAAKVEPFKLEWVFGFNKGSKVINLFRTNVQKIFFNITQCGVIFDYKNSQMNFLQGHPNKIISISSTYDGKFLVTADSGPDNIIIVWYSSTFSPVMVYFDPYDGRHILGTEFNSTGEYLVTVGEYSEDEIKIDFRIWSKGEDEPNAFLIMKNPYGSLIKIQFEFDNETKFILLFEKMVAFFRWDSETDTLSEPTIPTIRYKGKLGNFTDLTHIHRCYQIMASTSEGCVVIYGPTLYYQHFNENEEINDIIAVKTCKITKVSVNTIDSADGMVITGDQKGIINIFDKKLRLLFWYTNYIGKPIQSIRFNMIPRKFVVSTLCTNEFVETTLDILSDSLYEDFTEQFEIIYKDQIPHDASIQEEQRVVRDFIVAQSEVVIYIDFIKNIHTPIYNRGIDYIGAITIHEDFNYLVVGYRNGFIFILNYVTNFLHNSYKLPYTIDEVEDKPTTITCIQYSPKSLHLACGRSNGEVWILDPILLKPKQEVVRFTAYAIEKITFSIDNKQLAYCNSRLTVYFMIFNETDLTWVFMGKARSHYKTISEIFFHQTDPKILVTVGTDRFLVTYNNVNFKIGDEFQAITKVRIDQSAVPLAGEVYPAKHCDSKFRYFIVADDQHKYKLINEDTQMCRFVALGPAYGCYQETPVKKIKILPLSDENYIVYMTKKHIGLQKLPVTGNPYSFVGCLGHPEELLDFQISGDGDYVFTVGNNETTVLKWKIKTRGVDLMNNLGGQDFEPLYCIIEGGKNGYLFQEMQDLFFYMQIVNHGLNNSLPRRCSELLAITEIPDLMRACGFYPTEFESETLLVDIKYRTFDKDGVINDYISFLDFLKLFLNHKPAYGYSVNALEDMFNIFSQCVEEPIPGIIKRDDFLEMLTQEGEPLSLTQMHKCMATLLDDKDVVDGEPRLFSFIPEDIDYHLFIHEMLGIDMMQDYMKIVEKVEADGSVQSSND